MKPRNQTLESVSELEDWLSNSDVLASPLISALYVSSDRDTKPLTFLHPEFLEEQAPETLPAPNFFIYNDAKEIEHNIHESYFFEDRKNKTRISAADEGEANLVGRQGRLISVKWESCSYKPRHYFVWILSSTNDSFTRFALSEGWRPTWFIGVCDSCSFHQCDAGQFGCPCVNMLDNVQTSIPVRLNARYWVTDHIVGATINGSALSGGEDPENGDTVIPEDPDAEISARQVCFLSTLFRGEPRGTGFRGGARVFEIES